MNAARNESGQPRLPGMDATGGGNAKEPLQIRIPIGVKRRFKALAAMRGIEPNELFVEVWEHYEQTRTAKGEQGEQR
ncbi:hypothetical protein [Roseomonas rosulenta]|uniref:hypothetical protein n=1 Tax=Roseomonas rosulenta TaxID=2748667 RepID=UPI0018DFC099|nr:hypothetical protein [Roseomonas rosulenta]